MLPTDQLKPFFFANEQQLIRSDELLYISNPIYCIKILEQLLILSILSLSSIILFFFSLILSAAFFFFLSFSPWLLFFSHSLCEQLFSPLFLFLLQRVICKQSQISLWKINNPGFLSQKLKSNWYANFNHLKSYF